MPDSQWRSRFRRRLKTWFTKNARDLPWRETCDPYAVWVSEIMLQQTQVETVKSYFARFMTELPTVGALADADEERVLRLWEGLGYYRRARQLHKAAKVIVEEHAGKFPTDVESLQKLPGIGRYTAGAIASIAFDERAPILEANTVRLFARLMAVREVPTSTPAQKQLWAFAEAILPKADIGHFNQALMELGALVCTPRAPACDACPVMSLCPTFAQGLQDAIPAAKQKMQFEDVREAAVVIRRNGSVLLRRCCDGERWAGLWDFPRVSITGESNNDADEITAKVAGQIGAPIELGQHLTTLKHGVTRYRITLTCYAGICSAKRFRGNGTEIRWIDVAELSSMPLSTTGRKLAALIDDVAATHE